MMKFNNLQEENAQNNEITNEITNEFTNEITNEITNEFTNEITNEFTNEITNEFTNEITKKLNYPYKNVYFNNTQNNILNNSYNNTYNNVYNHTNINSANNGGWGITGIIDINMNRNENGNYKMNENLNENENINRNESGIGNGNENGNEIKNENWVRDENKNGNEIFIPYKEKIINDFNHNDINILNNYKQCFNRNMKFKTNNNNICTSNNRNNKNILLNNCNRKHTSVKKSVKANNKDSLNFPCYNNILKNDSCINGSFINRNDMSDANKKSFIYNENERNYRDNIVNAQNININMNYLKDMKAQTDIYKNSSKEPLSLYAYLDEMRIQNVFKENCDLTNENKTEDIYQREIIKKGTHQRNVFQQNTNRKHKSLIEKTFLKKNLNNSITQHKYNNLANKINKNIPNECLINQFMQNKHYNDMSYFNEQNSNDETNNLFMHKKYISEPIDIYKTQVLNKNCAEPEQFHFNYNNDADYYSNNNGNNADAYNYNDAHTYKRDFMYDAKKDNKENDEYDEYWNYDNNENNKYLENNKYIENNKNCRNSRNDKNGKNSRNEKKNNGSRDNQENRENENKDDENIDEEDLIEAEQRISKMIKEKLEENECLLHAINEQFKVGRIYECNNLFERLQLNLFFLALIADAETDIMEDIETEWSD